VGVTDLKVVADPALEGRRDMTTGANEDGFHLRGVDVARDLAVAGWADLREVREGEGCPLCGNPLAIRKTIEIGHIFKLGTRYSEAMDVTVLDPDGKARPIVMGCYGIGVGRAMAAVVEAHHDAVGIQWPVDVAPFEVVVTVLNPKDVETSEAGGQIHDALRDAGIDVILDDRDERPGVKFKDAELVGIPYRITVGPKGLADKKVELHRRRDGHQEELDLHRAADVVSEYVLEERR
jgi:prolyl-tRNA synthetase